VHGTGDLSPESAGRWGRLDRSRLARDTLISLAAISLVGGSASVYSILIGRTMGERALGQAGLALAVGLGAAQLAMAGLAPALTRFCAAYRATGRPAAARASVLLGLIAALALGLVVAAVAAATAGGWAGRIGLRPALVTGVAVLIFLQTAYIGLKAALYGLGRVLTYAWAELAAGLVFAAALIALLTGAMADLLGPFIAANLIFGVLAGGVVWGAVRALGPPTAGAGGDRLDGRGFAHYTAVATVGSAAALARQPLAIMVTGAWWPAGEVGLLQAALALLPVVLLLPRAVELTLFPELSRAYGRADLVQLRRQTVTGLHLSLVLLSLLAGDLLLLGPNLLGVLYGPAFVAAGGALAAVVVAGWATGLAVPAVAALSGADGVAIPNLAAVAGLAASLLAWAWLVPGSGATGAAAGLAAGAGVVTLICLVVAWRRYDLGLAALWPTVGWILLLLGTMLLLVRRSLLPPWLGVLGYTAGVAVAGGLGWWSQGGDRPEDGP
jgi:O-antigen/teichoic acid export membrane protein